MRALDRYLGSVLCAAAALVSRLRRRRPACDRPQSILIVKCLGLGSICLAGRALSAVRRAYPDARITFLTFAENRELLAPLGVADEVLAVRTDGLIGFGADAIRIVCQLVRMRFDVALDLETASRFTAILTWLSGAPSRVGLVTNAGPRRLLLTHPVVWDERKHVSEAFCDVAATAGARDTGESIAALQIPRADMSRADEMLAEAGIAQGDDFVVVNVNAGPMSLERRWPQEHFAELARWLLDKHHLPLVFIGSAAERGYVAEAVGRIGDDDRVINMAGATDLGCLLGMLARAKLVITNDTGPLHLSAAVGTPTVSFFGPETPERYGPAGERHTVLRAPLACSPCLSAGNMKTAPCRGDNLCMRQIPVTDAVAAVQRRL
ncbi:MAG: glycosyltransferase family 9 protein [Armatimonadota bacterium]